MTIAIVTGAAQGLGAAIANRLVRDGDAVMYADIRASVAETAAAARGGGQTAHRILDISDEAAAAAAVEATVSEFAGLDLLVNCAGVGGAADAVVDLSLKDFNRTLEVNLSGSFLMARAAARVFTARGNGGVIVNIGSLFGQQGAPNNAAYSASKAGITAFTQTLAQELGGAGIRVNTIAPGFMATDLHYEELESRASRRGSTVDDELQSELRDVPLARLGTGDDIAGVVRWLASDDSAYVTGQTIAVNGGFLMS